MIRLSIADPLQLTDVLDLIHDRWFDVEEICFDRGAAELVIPFRGSVRERKPGRRARLRIHHARGNVRDTSQVGSYDFNELEYDEKSHRLRITTGIPLDFHVEVARFALTVEVPDVYSWLLPIQS